MNPYRSSPNGRAQRPFLRLLSPRVIVTKVNAMFRRLFHKTEQAPMPTLEEWEVLARETEHVQTPHREETREERVQGEAGGSAPIEVLSSEVLLEIFDCHRLLALRTSGPVSVPWEWHRLAHVCGRWRSIIFGSQHRLNLQLVYTYKQPVRKTLDLWPALPVAIRYPGPTRYRPVTSQDEGNVIAALKHPNRICELNIPVTKSLLGKSALLLRASFPALECLRLGSQDATMPLILPIGFLGGSTPRLRDIHLTGTAYSALPLLIMSARELVSLQLDDIPNTGYFTPEALAAGLSATTQLKLLKVYFHPSSSRPDQRRTPLPPPSRSILPALTDIQFRGNGDYLEDLVARIDAPAVEELDIKFLEPNTFDTPQLAQFIDRTKTLRSPHRTSIRLSEDDIAITHDFRLASPSSASGTIRLQISCDDVDRQMAILVHVGRQFSRLLSSVEALYVDGSPMLFSLRDPRETDSAKWLELLRHFRGARKFEVTGALVANVASTLEQVTGNMARGILPSLRDLHLDGSDSSTSPSIEPFVAARRLSSHPVSVHYMTRDDSSDNPSDVESSLGMLVGVR